jgi:hypothetical protein
MPPVARVITVRSERLLRIVLTAFDFTGATAIANARAALFPRFGPPGLAPGIRAWLRLGACVSSKCASQ